MGWGEALPLPAFGGESYSACEVALRAGTATLCGMEIDAAPERLTADAPVARSALETALLDLSARRAGHSLAGWLGAPSASTPVPVNALLAADAPDALADEAAAAQAAGFSCSKLKVGVGSLAEDLERVRAVRA